MRSKFQIKHTTSKMKRNDTGKVITSPLTFEPKNVTIVDSFRLTFGFSIISNKRCWHSSRLLYLSTCHLQESKLKRRADHLFILSIASANIHTQSCSILLDFTSWMWLSWGSVNFHGSSGRQEVQGEKCCGTQDFGRKNCPKNQQMTFYGSADWLSGYQ